MYKQAQKPNTNSTLCPRCNSYDHWRDGHRMLNNGTKVQRWLCRTCSFRFTDPKSRRVHMHKNIKSVEKATGATEQIFDLSWHMKKEGYKEVTIRTTVVILNMLIKKGVNLSEPESVKEYIASRDDWSEGRKVNIINAYERYTKYYNITWDRPRITRRDKLPFIPTEREIDDLIAGCSKYIAVALQIAKETASRIGEIFDLAWTDIDFERKTIVISAEKGSNSRIFKISNKLIGMLNRVPKDNEKIFFGHYKDVRHLRRTFERQRKRIADKLGNKRILKIHFHTLRHWKATMEYDKTKDILHVKDNILGHKNINNTLKYIRLVTFEEDDSYISKVAKTIDEIAKLVEQGFEYVCEHEGYKIFRKRR